QFLREKTNDALVRHRTALAFHRTFWVYVNFTDPSVKRQERFCYEQSHRLLQQLHDQEPNNPRYQYDLAAVEVTGGWFSYGTAAEIEQHYRRTIALLEPMVQDPPNNVSL